MKYFRRGFSSVLMVALVACSDGQQVLENSTEVQPDTTRAKPNILLIVADDLGYTDLGVFGGEIPTPTLDSLAQSGITLTEFYAAPTCSPTRSMLMSGTDNHRAGLGSMAEFMRNANPELLKQPGYEGYLNERVAPLPQLLRDAGYETFMTGKWHLGKKEEQSPAARGFDKSFVLLEGGAGHLSNLGMTKDVPLPNYREDGKKAEIPEDFYSTQFYAERMKQYLASRVDKDKPFFAYLAYTAPHWPLQAPAESIARHKGKYDAGYQVLLAERMQRQKDIGLIPADVSIDDYVSMLPDWNALSEDEQRYEARRMEVYAAMIDDLDRYTGMLIDYLKSEGEYENTLIFFMSDNGAQPQGAPYFYRFAQECCDNSYENLGSADSYVFPEPNWARVSTGLFKGFKGSTNEGGVRVPAFVNLPSASTNGASYNHLLTVKDILPTFLEFAGVEHPGTVYQGHEVHPLQGESFASVAMGNSAAVHAEDYAMGWELFGGKAMRQGDWKLVYASQHDTESQWELYNLAQDPGETTDLSIEEPEKFEALMQLWSEYAESNGVVVDSH